MESSAHTTEDTGDRLVSGLEAIIDAATGVLAAQSLEETLQGMADALAPIVPYTSLAVFEVVWSSECSSRCWPPAATCPRRWPRGRRWRTRSPDPPSCAPRSSTSLRATRCCAST